MQLLRFNDQSWNFSQCSKLKEIELSCFHVEPKVVIKNMGFLDESKFPGYTLEKVTILNDFNDIGHFLVQAEFFTPTLYNLLNSVMQNAK